METIGQEDPFEQPPSPLSPLPHEPGKAASLFKYDVWRTCHLGVCKALIGTALALLSDLQEGRSKDARFEGLNHVFMTWCKQNHRQPLITKLTKDTIGWDNNANFPQGSWYKGSLSTTFCDFIEDMTKDQVFEDVLLTKTAEAVRALNIFLRGLYESDVFLESERAHYLGEQGLRFLRRYSWCASESVRQGRCLFLLLPKAHCLQHICLNDLVLDSQIYTKNRQPDRLQRTDAGGLCGAQFPPQSAHSPIKRHKTCRAKTSTTSLCEISRSGLPAVMTCTSRSVTTRTNREHIFKRSLVSCSL